MIQQIRKIALEPRDFLAFPSDLGGKVLERYFSHMLGGGAEYDGRLHYFPQRRIARDNRQIAAGNRCQNSSAA